MVSTNAATSKRVDVPTVSQKGREMNQTVSSIAATVTVCANADTAMVSANATTSEQVNVPTISQKGREMN